MGRPVTIIAREEGRRRIEDVLMAILRLAVHYITAKPAHAR